MGFAKKRAEAFSHNLFKKASVSTNNQRETALRHLIDENDNTYWTSDRNDQVVIQLKLPYPETLNAVVLEEMIAYGQRVIRFSIEAKQGDQFVKVFEGTTIGRKKIATFPKVATNEIKIIIHESKAQPVLRSLSAFYIQSID